MKNWGIGLSVILLLLSFCCRKKEPTEKAFEERKGAGAAAEIDVQKVEAATGISFKILKTEAVGFMPRHKFFWVCVPERASKEKIEGLASAIIKETIAANPAAFHSVTIHFFSESELGTTVEASKAFARPTFLPEGNWVKVGRVPIDDYKDYVLNCVFLD